MQTLWHDLRYAIRMLRKKPGFTAVAVVTLAMAIGANAVVFSALNGVILRPLNVPHAESLFQVGGPNDPSHSYPDYLDLRDRNRSFDGLAAYTFSSAGLDTGKNPSHAWVSEVSGNYFDVLGIQPCLGRVIHAADEQGPNSAPYIVLTYAYWHSHFEDDRGVVGRTVQLNKHPFTILGVTPPGFHGTILFFWPDFFVPMVNQAQVDGWNGLNDRGNRWVGSIIGHLKAGVTPEQAIADLNSIGSYLQKTYPKEDSQMRFIVGREGLPGVAFGRGIKAFLAGLMLLAGLILLAACANLGSLFAARAADRSREVALRLALGSTRTRILRQLFTEAVLISLVGGALGLFSSVMLLRGLSAWQPISRFPIVHLAVNPDAKVYGVALLLTLASGFLFGAVPVRQVLRTSPYEVVKAGATGRVGRRVTGRDVLLVVQIAICAVLVTSSLVAARGLARSLHNNFGFELKTTVANTDLNMAGYSGERVPAMQKRMFDALKTIPGVESVGFANALPLADYGPDPSVFTDDTADLRPSN